MAMNVFETKMMNMFEALVEAERVRGHLGPAAELHKQGLAVFQWQHAAEPWLVMTALVVAAIPTLIVFTFCQRIIMRGIVLPSMK